MYVQVAIHLTQARQVTGHGSLSNPVSRFPRASHGHHSFPSPREDSLAIRPQSTLHCAAYLSAFRHVWQNARAAREPSSFLKFVEPERPRENTMVPPSEVKTIL